MVIRSVRSEIEIALGNQSAVVLFGLPCTGRSELAATWLYDVELGVNFNAALEPDRECLNKTTAFLELVEGHLVIIDDIDDRAVDSIIQLVREARNANSATRFLLMPRQQISMNKLLNGLIGCVDKIELCPLHPYEIFGLNSIDPGPTAALFNELVETGPVSANPWNQEMHWLRGGLPESFYAKSDEASFNWRTRYCESLLRSDLTTWGAAPADRPNQIIEYLVSNHGKPFNIETCGTSIGVKKQTVETIVYRLTQLGLMRTLGNFAGGPDVIHLIRDSGLYHALSGIKSLEQLRLDDTAYGHSWEGFATEALIMALPKAGTAKFYRDQEHREIDLILDFRVIGGPLCAIEFKANEDRDPRKGFWTACDIIKPTDRFVIHSGKGSRMGRDGLRIVSLKTAIEEILSPLS